uniref:GntR family transcriptional regulator n=2 Tax=Bursaphelenchus xylophilus TaxID=6326 RepID=A0A1I7SPU1_BURXY
VETAIELLREWGLEASSQGGTILLSDEPSSSSSLDTPTTSRTSFRLPQTPDRILRRWLASEIGL